MSRYPYLLLTLMTFLTKNSFGQDTLVKYLMIDTVVFERNVNKYSLYDGTYFKGLLLTGNTHSSFIDHDWLNENYPNYFSKIRFINSDSLSIGIIIDDKQSTIWLNHLERLPDTIRIKKWSLFHNQLQDSFSQWIGYYHINDSSKTLYKEKTKKSLTNRTNEKTCSNIRFILNDRSYEVPLIIQHQMNIFWGHGYPTKRDKKKSYRSFDDPQKHKPIRYNKFAISQERKQKIYTGSINFINN